MNFIYFYLTDIGNIGVEENGRGITNLYLPGAQIPPEIVEEETSILYDAGQQLQNYFIGQQREFILPLAPAGTEFMRKVWNNLLSIPYGETRSYAEVARLIGNKKACRAVGSANHRNPLPIIVPCHRVIGSDGKLVGYGGGLKIKSYLLELEKYYSSLDQV
ncbi:MAG TPA: methylated-DNA--[protein]-cysteine S-methyltransferase [Syntrophomonas sp.]|nr:methylated-DNA--[protein]-cysteine S-methyltransferase [Syntrophomonas sp.]